MNKEQACTEIQSWIDDAYYGEDDWTNEALHDVIELVEKIDTTAHAHWEYEFIFNKYDYYAHYAIAKCSKCGAAYMGKHKNAMGHDDEGRTELFSAFFTNYRGHEESAKWMVLDSAKENCPPETLWKYCPECGARMDEKECIWS